MQQVASQVLALQRSSLGKKRWTMLPRALHGWACQGRRPLASVGHATQTTAARRLSIFARLTRRRRLLPWKAASTVLLWGLLVYSLFPAERLPADSPDSPDRSDRSGRSARQRRRKAGLALVDGDGQTTAAAADKNAWASFTSAFEGFSNVTDIEWSVVSDRIANLVLPDWSKMVPGYLRKLQREMSLAPGSLADEMWREARDPQINPEVQYAARVRVSDSLCREEEAFRARRKPHTAAALARYLGLDPAEVDPDDVPVIAICGSGGGLRALVAGTGSLMAASEAGLFDCATYTAGVSGSCWLQALYLSSLSEGHFDRVADHLRARLGVHIAYPPEAFGLLTSAPTNRPLLSGTVEKLKGDARASFGLVDVYGILLAARLLVPKGELGVCDLDFKLSNQARFLARGQHPMPIYTAVRHEIPGLEIAAEMGEPAKKRAGSKSANTTTDGTLGDKSWFQWFEMTPYEFFCEEFAAGIPTWAMGRKFYGGQDVPPEPGSYHLPEMRLPLMLGIFGSAFCATLSHYYKEVRPVVQSLTGLRPLDDVISGRTEDLSRVHPIDPATMPNPLYGMDPHLLPSTVPASLPRRPYIQLMDAGMSNNLPLYPFMRPGRNVEVVVVFDASADIQKDNWLNVADGYARERGIKGWPVGVGWPQPDESPQQAVQDLRAAQADSSASAVDRKLAAAQSGAPPAGEAKEQRSKADEAQTEEQRAQTAAKKLGYCTVWVGSTAEKVKDVEHVSQETPAEAIDESTHWRLTAPDAGLTLVYLPYLANEKRVPGINPATTEFMSTWNFIYTPQDVDAALALARANYQEGAEQIRRTVRAVYERKKQLRLQALVEQRKARVRRHLRMHGDHFS